MSDIQCLNKRDYFLVTCCYKQFENFFSQLSSFQYSQEEIKENVIRNGREIGDVGEIKDG